MFNVAICDDDKNFIQYVEDIIKELGYAEDVKFFEYLSGEEFLFDIDERGDLDTTISSRVRSIRSCVSSTARSA